jgi:hypothetical protein
MSASGERQGPDPRWHRQPLMALVLGLPLLTLAAGIVTIALAARAPDADGADLVGRVAQVQTADFTADLRAARDGLAADLVVGGDGVRVRLEGAARRWPHELRLRFAHAGDASRDHIAVLVCAASRCRGEYVLSDARAAWQLALAPADGSWRLVGRLAAGAERTTLLPRLAPAP